MKRTLVLVLAFILTFSFMTGAMATNKAAATPTPTPAPTLVKKNTANEIKEIKKFTLKLCDMENPTNDRFEYAQYTIADDWKKTKGFPAVLYKYPYNINCAAPSTKYSKFKTNRELQAELSEATLKELVSLANTLAVFQVNANSNSFESDEYAKKAKSVIFPNSLLGDIKDFKAYDLKHKLKAEGGFVADKSLIYQAVDGTICVRGRLFLRPISGSQEASYLDDMNLGEWYYIDTEYMIMPVKELCEKQGIKQWTNNKYAITWYTYLHGTWQKATNSQVDWYKENKV